MKTAPTPLRFGLIGAGAIAQTYLQAFKDLPGGRLVAIADPRREAAAAAAEAASCAAYDSPDALADAADCDAVIVCTPPVTHAPICHSFINRGVAVLCEKPLCLDPVTALELRTAAEARGVVLTMASKFRFVDDMVRARGLVLSGLLGQPVQIENSFTARISMANRWNSDPTVAGGGVLIDNGTHSVDIIRFLCGPIEAVCATAQAPVEKLAVEDTVTLLTRSAGGVQGLVDLSWSLDKKRDHYLSVYGTHGMLQLGWRSSSYRQYASSESITFGKGYDKGQAFRSLLDNFIGAVRGVGTPLVTIDDAIASVHAISAAYTSLDSGGGWVRLADADPLAMTRAA